MVIDSLTQQTGNVKVLKSQWATTARLPARRERHRGLPNSLNTSPVVPGLQLTTTYDGSRLLREVGLS